MSVVWQLKTSHIDEISARVFPLFDFKQPIVIKPNIVSAQPYPVTTDVNLVSALINYLQSNGIYSIIVADGSSDNTMANFEVLGYKRMADELGVELVDLNDCDVVELRNENARVLKRFMLPKILKNRFIVSLANLKEHHSAGVTLSLKNMFGIAPGKYYSHNKRNKPWQKEMLHDLGIADSIIDITNYCMPDIGMIDGRIAQLGSEQYGPTRRMDVFLASNDCIALDIAGAHLLNHEIDYILELQRMHNTHVEVKNI